MVAVLVAQDCVLLLVILVVRGAAEVALALAQEAVTAAAVVIVMDVQALVKTSVREVARPVVKAVVPVAQDVQVGVLVMDVAPIALEIVVLV